MKLENLGSIITIEGKDECLGFLMHFEGRGVYDAAYGLVDVSPEQADTHNKLLDEALLKGLDENCQVGQRGTFYFVGNEIRTFLGTVVSDDLSINGRSVTFRRAGKTYKGRSSKQYDLFHFRRIA